MRRRTILRVLLSLLLLTSQHMAFAHALSHWAGMLYPGFVQQQDDDRNSSLSAAVAQDQSCDHCLAFAQLAAPLAGSMRAFVAGEIGTAALPSGVAVSFCARAPCGFYPRAPPSA